MERPLTLRPLSIQDENSTIHHKKAAINGKSKSSKPISKKGGAALESRKALNDITNKSSIPVEASLQKKKSQNKRCDVVEDVPSNHRVSEAKVPLKKKILVDEKVNIAEETFLHDHNKCVDAQKSAVELNFWDTVFPGHDSAVLIMDEQKSDPVIERQEISMLEISVWFDSLWKSPPSSPVKWNSPPGSPFKWDLEPFELKLKEEDEYHV